MNARAIVVDALQALDKAFAEIDALHARRRREARAEIRAARRERIRLFARHPQSFWGFVNLFRPQPLLSTEEAVVFHAKKVRQQKRLIREDHWSADFGKLAMHREREVTARYFRRFGRRVWQRRAA